jgi:metallo-beta-lactamase class B
MSYILTAIAVFLGVSFSMVQVSIAQKADAQETDPSLVYSSPSLAIHQVTENTYLHISYLPTKSWGNVPCNGMVFINDSHVAVFDTPVSDSVSQELIGWIQDSLHGTVSAIVVNHFHNDCLGGLQAFHDAEIPSYASNKTIEFAQVDAAAIPQNGFDNKLVLNIGTAEIMNIFVGEAHTQDNIVSYVPSEKVVFGGCLVKSVDASKVILAMQILHSGVLRRKQ